MQRDQIEDAFSPLSAPYRQRLALAAKRFMARTRQDIAKNRAELWRKENVD